MHLGNPAALWLLALVPLLMLARLRRPAVRRTVAHLPFWRDAARSSAPAPARTLRRDPLLLVQVAIVVAVVVALAAPHVGIPGRHVVLLVDVSMSMGARHDTGTRLERARAEAIALARRLPWGTAVDVIAAGALPQEVASNEDAAAAERALEGMAVTSAAADFDAALDRARRMLPDRIYVFSDVPRPPEAGDSPPVEWTTIARPIENVAVSGVSARRSTSDPRALQVLVTVTNHGSLPVRTDVAVAGADGELWREAVALDGRSSVTLSRAVESSEGTITARLELQDDLAADDVRTLAVPPVRSHRVMAPGAGSMIAAALASHPDVELVGADASVPGVAGIFVCDGCSEMDAPAAGVLAIPRGGTERMAPAPLVMTDEGPFPDLRLDGELVVPLGDFPVPPNSTIVARAAGVPVILARDEGTRRVVEIRFDPGSSAVSLSPAFPVLIDAALDWLSMDARNPVALVAGTPLLWVLPVRPSNVAITEAGGADVPFTVSEGRLLTSPLEAGVYEVHVDAVTHHVSVNPPPVESDPGAFAAQIASETPVRRGGRELRTDVSWMAAAFALLLVLLEWRLRTRWVAVSGVRQAPVTGVTRA